MRYEYTNAQAIEAITQVVHNERDRRMMLRRYIDGVCFEPLAEEFDMSVRHVKRLAARYEPKIFAYVRRRFP